MTKSKTDRAPRVEKKIKAVLDTGTGGIIENISTTGGFLRLDGNIPTQPFQLELKLSEFKSVKMTCAPQWHNDQGVGFKVAEIQEAKEDLFNTYVENQLSALKDYGEDRVCLTEITITLKNTNAFGNVYFSNFIEFQGVVREKFLMANVPDLHDLMTSQSVRLVTVDTYNRFISNAYFGDTIVAELTTSEIKAATCRLNITFRDRVSGKLFGEGYQRFCVVSNKGKVIRIPETFLEPLNFYQEIKE